MEKRTKLCLDGAFEAFEEFSPTQMTLIGWKRGQISPRDDGTHLFVTLHFPSFQKMEPICLEHDIFPPFRKKKMEFETHCIVLFWVEFIVLANHGEFLRSISKKNLALMTDALTYVRALSSGKMHILKRCWAPAVADHFH